MLHSCEIILNLDRRCRLKKKFMHNGHTSQDDILRPKGSGFEPHRRHCVVVLEQDTFILA